MALSYNKTWAANFVRPKNTPLPVTKRPAHLSYKRGKPRPDTVALLKNQERTII